jgi:phage terminase large subunit
MAMALSDLQGIVPAPFFPFFIPSKWRYKVFHGGRGGAKSQSAARAIATICDYVKLDVLYAREFQNSIDDSSYRDLVSAIEELGIADHYDIGKTTVTNLRTGSTFKFMGLRHNLGSIKSKSKFDLCIVEEAENVSKDAWDTLDPTLRSAWSEIWVIFNAKDPESDTYKRFVLNPPPNAYVRKINYDENPFFPEVLRIQMEHCRASDPDGYAHIWLGFPKEASDAQIFRGKWVIDEFDPYDSDGKVKPGWDGPYFGVDWGFSVDPTAATKSWVYDNSLYIEYEAGGVGIELDDLAATFDKIPGMRQHVSRADNARPETISHVKNKGGYKRMVAVDKWKGSVEDGIEHMRSYTRIVIHPRCRETQNEFRLYSYKETQAGDITTDILDKWNHFIDSIRYALTPLMTRKGKAKVKPLKV